VRHAHRQVNDPSEDNGLSEKGKLQAKLIASYFQKTYPNIRPLLLSSPRARCQETLQPLANLLKVSVELSDLLDEGAQSRAGSLENRSKKFLHWWKNEPSDFCIACSHGDWIPLFFEHSLGESFSLKKGGWAELRLNQGRISLHSLIQSWKDKNLEDTTSL
jgi:broad specificity phosphatase PhoE